jgi:hypothetical protein
VVAEQDICLGYTIGTPATHTGVMTEQRPVVLVPVLGEETHGVRARDAPADADACATANTFAYLSQRVLSAISPCRPSPPPRQAPRTRQHPGTQRRCAALGSLLFEIAPRPILVGHGKRGLSAASRSRGTAATRVHSSHRHPQ